MTTPLAFVCYERLLPGSQLVNRLQDLGYRTQVVEDLTRLVELAEREKPMLLVADLAAGATDICAVIRSLKKNASTRHIPVLAFTGQANTELQTAARQAGATLVAVEDAILSQLPQLLEQVLQVD